MSAWSDKPDPEQPPTLTDAEYERAARQIDARMWPILDRFLATIGMTREQLFMRAAQPAPARLHLRLSATGPQPRCAELPPVALAGEAVRAVAGAMATEKVAS